MFICLSIWLNQNDLLLLQTILCVPTGSGVVELGSTDLVGVRSFVLSYFSCFF
jgi:hypothetical protein